MKSFGLSAAQMVRLVKIVLEAAGVLYFATPEAGAQDWQAAAQECYADTGAAGAAYRSTCKNHDQYESILACEAAAGEENAMARTRMAGPGVVDTVMMDFGKVDGCQ
jgi:hypothetical protein